MATGNVATANFSILSGIVSFVTTPIQSFVSGASALLKAHENLIIIILLVGGSIFVAQKYFAYSSAMADKQVQADSQKLQTQLAAQQAATQAAQQAAVAAQNAQAAYQQLVQNVTAQNAAIVSAMNQRNTQTATQQKTDSTLTNTALGARMATLSNVSPDTISSGPASMSLTYPTALAVTQQLELIPSLQADLSSFQTEDKNKDTELSSCNNTVTALNTQTVAQQAQITNDKNVLADTQKKDADALTAEKKVATKGKLKWFGIGYVAGFISGVFVHGA